nr:lytic murein transglycosylase [Alteromonas aestuariivivens]
MLFWLLLVSFPLLAEEKSEQGFQHYLQTLRKEAQAQGFQDNFLDGMFADIAYRPTVIKSDRNQPERKITLDSYLETRVPDWKVKQAIELSTKHRALLEEISAKYKVQSRFIVALWGNESNFGRIQGSFDVLSALSSLAYEGRREALFKKQFFAALQILHEGHVQKAQFKGSWAGAMGQSQFMPTSFLNYAVDYDGDGKKDIWANEADVFASIANFLSKEGWDGEGTWGRQVILTQGYDGSHGGLDKDHYVTLSTWQKRGVRRYNGQALPSSDIKASLIMPDGIDGRIYLVYNNFHTLMKWNRSSYFGIAVGYLSERIKQGN